MNQTLAFQLPSLASSLQSYIQAINKFPLLSAEEEYRLACRLRDHDDVEAAKTLVLSHLRVVVSVARNYMGYGLPQADLIQEGNIGLMKAVKRFDPERGVRLVSFALHWVRAEIHEFVLRNWRLVKVATTKAQRKLFFNLRSMKKGVGNSLSPDEANSIAKQLGVKAEEVIEMETRLSGQDIALDSSGHDDDESFSPIAYLTNHEQPALQMEENQTETLRLEGLEKALGELDARSRRIIEARWLKEQDTATLHDLAAEFDISAERVRQIEQKAMQKMKSLMAP